MGFLGKLKNAFVCWVCWTGWVAIVLIAVDAALNSRLYDFWDGVSYLFMFILFSFFTYVTIDVDVKEDEF